MTQEEKDLNKSNAKTKQVKSLNEKSTNKSAKTTPPNKAEVEKVIKDAEKSLNKIDEPILKNSKKQEITSKVPKDKSIKDMTSYQEQALQDVTKSKSNKKMLIIILILIGLAIVAGVGIALFLMFKPKEEPPKAVVCKVEVLSYRVEKEVNPERYIVIGEGDEFDFNEGSEQTTSYTKDLETSISDVRDVSLVYLVNNVTSNNYVYTLDFSNIIIENCNVEVKINDGETYSINDTKRIVTISQQGDVVLEVRISVKDTTIPDIADNTRCVGGIDFTLSVS